MRFFYLMIGLGLGFAGGAAVVSTHNDNNASGDKPTSDDVAKSCRVVTHSDSTGFKFWNCEKIR